MRLQYTLYLSGSGSFGVYGTCIFEHCIGMGSIYLISCFILSLCLSHNISQIGITYIIHIHMLYILYMFPLFSKIHLFFKLFSLTHLLCSVSLFLSFYIYIFLYIYLSFSLYLSLYQYISLSFSIYISITIYICLSLHIQLNHFYTRSWSLSMLLLLSVSLSLNMFNRSYSHIITDPFSFPLCRSRCKHRLCNISRCFGPVVRAIYANSLTPSPLYTLSFSLCLYYFYIYMYLSTYLFS